MAGSKEGGPSYSEFHIQGSEKQSIFDELLELLRKLLKYCLCCVTCGCIPARNGTHFNREVYETQLMEDEKQAVQDLLEYLDSEHAKSPSINEERLRALCILTYSDNEELQQSAALCFAEISQKMKHPITPLVVEPLVTLLRSRYPGVKKAASLATSNFALQSNTNKKVIVDGEGVPALVHLLSSQDVEVQCNACGCLTTLATVDKTKEVLIESGGILPLLNLARSDDIRVQRNANGALLNLTHKEENRNELVQHGALPVLVEVLKSPDTDVQYYCAAALSNLAVDERHRTMMVAVGKHDVICRLIQLLSSHSEKVKCQVCFSLRNLASDGDNQVMIVRLGALRPLHHVIQTCRGETLVASLACLHNLSIHRSNELHIIAETFLSQLKRVIKDFSKPEAQIHAAGTIRNLAAGDQIQVIGESGCVESLCEVLMSSRAKGQILVEVTAALAVLSDDDATCHKLLQQKNGNVFRTLVYLASRSTNPQVQYNCAGTIGQMSLIEIPIWLLQKSMSGLLDYFQHFLRHSDPTFVHISLWTLLQFIKCSIVRDAFVGRGMVSYLEDLLLSQHSDAIKQLAQKSLAQMKEDPTS